MELPRSMDEISKIEEGTVYNGVDNANILSVDSTAPFPAKVDEVISEEDIDKDAKKKKLDEAVDKSKPSADTSGADKEKVPAKKEPPVEKRIGDLTKKWRSTERERDHERAKRLEAEAALKKLQESVPPEEKPKRDDFDNDEDYLESLADWKVEQKLKAKQIESDKVTKEASDLKPVEEAERETDEMKDRGMEAYSDFEEVVYREDLDITQDMLNIVLQTEIPEHILYFLGKNPDEAAKISKMTIAKAALALGKIEEKVAATIPDPNVATDGSTPPKKVTSAPDPINPVSSMGAVDKDPNKMTPKEYRAWRERNQ